MPMDSIVVTMISMQHAMKVHHHAAPNNRTNVGKTQFTQCYMILLVFTRTWPCIKHIFYNINAKFPTVTFRSPNLAQHSALPCRRHGRQSARR